MTSMTGYRTFSPTGAGGKGPGTSFIPSIQSGKYDQFSDAPGAGKMVGKVAGMQNIQLPQFNPDQMKLFQSLFGHLGQDSYLSRLAGGEEGLFNEMEAPAMRQFSGLQGQIASRFSGMGLGGRKSSGFQNTMNQAASDFGQDLQSRRQSMQQQAIRDLMGMSGQLLNQRPYEQILQKSFMRELLGGAAGGLTQAAATLPFML